MWEEIAKSLQVGNGYVLASLLLGGLGLVFIFERLFVFQFVYNCNFGKFLDHLRKMILARDLERARAFCKGVSSTALPAMAAQAVEASIQDPGKVEGVLEQAALDFLPHVERRIGALPGLATLAMLVGVLGTIDSLWQVFQAVDVLDTAKKQIMLSSGIASALTPTAFGLIVAVVVLSGHQLVRGMATSLVDRLQHGVAVLHHLLVPNLASGTVMAAPAIAGLQERGETPPPVGQATEAVPAHEAFNDAGVDDVKDEEEII